METITESVLFGLGPGAIIAALALGLVVAYRASGVINFGYGAIATYIVYVFVSLSNDGSYPVPPIPNPVAPFEALFDVEIFDIPTFVDLGGPLATPFAMAIALLTAAGLGVLMHVAVFRPLRYAPVLAKVVASVGIMLFLQSAVVLRFGSRAQQVDSLFPNSPVEVLGVRIGQDRLWIFGTVVVVTAALWALFQFTKFGVATRASAENEQFATLLGFNADRQAAISWVLSAVLAGLFGILVAPITGVTPTFFTLLIVSSLGAALLGKMSSFVIAAAGGLALGIGDQFLFRVELDWSWVPDIGLRRALPFIVIAAAMMIRGEALPSRGSVVAERMPEAVAPPLMKWRVGSYAVLIGCAFVLTVFAPFQYRSGMQNSLIGVILCLSLVVVTGYVGQISLMQMALAGVAAFAVASFGTEAGLPFLLAVPLAVVSSIIFGMIAGVPSLRTRGASLAIITLACGLAIEELFFNRTGWFGLAQTRKTTDPPEVFGIEFGPSSSFVLGDDKLPTAGFGLFLLIVCIAACVAVMRLRRSRLGEQMLAVRANERAAAAAGVNVRAVKLTAFAIASSLAGLAGSMTAFKLETYSADSFGIFASLTLLAFAYLGGISTVGGAIMASTLVAQGIGLVVTKELFIDVGAYSAYIAGFFLILTAIYNNEGIDGFQRAQFYSVVNRYRKRRGLAPLGELATDS